MLRNSYGVGDDGQGRIDGTAETSRRRRRHRGCRGHGPCSAGRGRTSGDRCPCDFKEIEAPMALGCISRRHVPGVRIGFACCGSQRTFPPREATLYPAAALLPHHVAQSKRALTRSYFVVLSFPAVTFSPTEGEADAYTRRRDDIRQVDVINFERVSSRFGILHRFPVIT
jgi:hypothetical protein